MLPQLGSDPGSVYEGRQTGFIVTTVPLLTPLSCLPTILPNVSTVRQHRLPRRGRATDKLPGYRPNSVLAIVVAAVYGTIGSALFFRAMRSRAWWGLCLPIGSFCKATSPTIP